MYLTLSPAASSAYRRLVRSDELGVLGDQLTPGALPHALARCNASTTFRLEHPHLVVIPEEWGSEAVTTVQRWDAEDLQLQKELLQYVRTTRVPLTEEGI